MKPENLMLLCLSCAVIGIGFGVFAVVVKVIYDFVEPIFNRPRYTNSIITPSTTQEPESSSNNTYSSYDDYPDPDPEPSGKSWWQALDMPTLDDVFDPHSYFPGGDTDDNDEDDD